MSYLAFSIGKMMRSFFFYSIRQPVTVDYSMGVNKEKFMLFLFGERAVRICMEINHLTLLPDKLPLMILCNTCYQSMNASGFLVACKVVIMF